jgi:hypothetical protein
MGARRSGRLGVGLAAAMCALFVFVVVSVDARPELQRDDWRGIARALGPQDGARAIVVSPINGSIPLRLYLPRSMDFPAAGSGVKEIDAVAVAPRVAGRSRKAPEVPAASPPSGFKEVSRHRGPTYTVVKYRAQLFITVSPTLIAHLALEPGTPDFVLQAAPPQR